MKNFDYLTLEVLSNEELANVRGGNGIHTQIFDKSAKSRGVNGIHAPIFEKLTSLSLSGGYGIPTPIIIED